MSGSAVAEGEGEAALVAPAHGGGTRQQQLDLQDGEEGRGNRTASEQPNIAAVKGDEKGEAWQEQGQRRVDSSLTPPSSPPARGDAVGGVRVHLDMPPPRAMPPMPPPMTMPPMPPPKVPGSVQRLLEKEGPDARNVVSWRVPNRINGFGGGGVVDSPGEAAEENGGPQQQQQHHHHHHHQGTGERASLEGPRERELNR